ncbi:hypothetical protein GCM10009828_022880 [Actinoplanes couchii]|uniref:Uncharacterized protein n=1 Tax=Actinoplanes couchii TaxID=403638 RepID=A0ABQ3XTN0_9ACTN|nr:hypothetical protein Aco03nite_102570 [Actinoplanes couchii]
MPLQCAGTVSDLQAAKAGKLITAAGVAYEYRSFPDGMYAMHATDPQCFAVTLVRWAAPSAAPLPRA